MQGLFSCCRLSFAGYLISLTLSLGSLINQRLLTTSCCFAFGLSLLLKTFCFPLNDFPRFTINRVLSLARGLLGVELGNSGQFGFMLSTISQQSAQGCERLVLDLRSLGQELLPTIVECYQLQVTDDLGDLRSRWCFGKNGQILDVLDTVVVLVDTGVLGLLPISQGLAGCVTQCVHLGDELTQFSFHDLGHFLEAFEVVAPGFLNRCFRFADLGGQ